MRLRSRRPFILSIFFLLLPAWSAQAQSMAEPLQLPMERFASGTAWQPDVTPMTADHVMLGEWMLMLHGLAFGGYDDQGSSRGGRTAVSMNWGMAMLSHQLAGGRITFRAMASLEPATVPPQGYPLLLQSGETYEGVPLHDVQHPHNFPMELAADYSRPIAASAMAFELYGGPAGEPALGPVAFPHRESAAWDPFAPLGHHWQDSTHVSYGVVTGGLFTREVKAEGSWFDGREPEGNRWDPQFHAMDSFAGRLSVNPFPLFSGQVSWGYLKSPESQDPSLSEHRITASVLFDLPFEPGNLAAAVVWGRIMEGPITSDAFLAEAALDLDGHHVISARAEEVSKTGADLDLPPAQASQLFPVTALSLGYDYDLGPIHGMVPGIGAMGTVDSLGAGLVPAYGTRLPLGGMVFLRLRAAH